MADAFCVGKNELPAVFSAPVTIRRTSTVAGCGKMARLKILLFSGAKIFALMVGNLLLLLRQKSLRQKCTRGNVDYDELLKFDFTTDIG